jgi:hypothetical protein
MFANGSVPLTYKTGACINVYRHEPFQDKAGL